MSKDRQIGRYAAFLVTIALGAVGIVVYRQHQYRDDGLTAETTVRGSSLPIGSEAAPVGEGKTLPAPRLASKLLGSSPDSTGAAIEREANTNRTEMDRFYREERRIMAKTWGFTEKQAADFEIAVDAATQELRAVLGRITRGKVAQLDMSSELRAADERAQQHLRRVLGPERLLEYQLMRGHFVEAGLDHKPFVPPTVMPAAASTSQPASSGAGPQTSAPDFP